MLRKVLPLVLSLPLVVVLGPGRLLSQQGGGAWRGRGRSGWRSGPPQIAVSGTPSTTNPAPPAKPTSPPGGQANSNSDPRALRYFQSLDKNNDGLLSSDEVPEALRAELAQWDQNHDNFIDATEFSRFYQAYRDKQRQLRAENNQQTQPQRQAPTGAMPVQVLPQPAPRPRPEEKKIVYHGETNLPKNLPAWFKQLDTDLDGQVSFAEWHEAKRQDDEFFRYDRNSDGFITVEEVLWDQAHGVLPADTRGAASTPGNGTNANSRFGRMRQ